MRKWFYPFTAIVGQESLKSALISTAIRPTIGGVLLRGERGTGKSTAARALADLLPEIEFVKGCPFNCNPRDISEMCDECLSKYEREEDLPVERRKMKVVDLPLSATEDRVVGSLNVEKALKEGLACLEPGLLAEANRGILYVDEVNLLEDHLVDILLDSAAMGLNIVEREGVSVAHPARFILIGTMNPEEGELRPQISDRFGLCVQIEALQDLELRKEIVRRREEFEKDPQAFQEKYSASQRELQERIIKARELLNSVEISEQLLDIVSRLSLDLNINTHRADIMIVATAKALAAFDGRTEVTMEDVTKAAKLALPHRFRRLPFEEIESKEQELEIALQNLQEKPSSTEKQETETEKAEVKEKGAQSISQDLIGVAGKAPKKKTGEIGGPINVNKILNMASNLRKAAKGYGKRFHVPSSTLKGRYVKPRLPQNKCHDIAVDATLRSAVLRLAQNNCNHKPFEVNQEDLRVKIRKTKTSFLIILVVDSSGSMNVYDRIEAAKGAAYSILTASYPKRDYVGIIIFKSSKAEVLMQPTKHLILGKRYLRDLPSTGKTPLAAGLYKALRVIENERIKIGLTVPIVVIISDGHANVPLNPSVNIEKELKAISKLFAEKGIHLISIDTERISNRFTPDVGYMKMIAENAQGSYYKIDEVTATAIEGIIQNEKVNITETIRTVL
ncbi:MAG: magnesium chelatase subunit D family protein [Candidatus Lokiarchaeia archaeon]